MNFLSKFLKLNQDQKFVKIRFKKGFSEALKMLNYERKHCQNPKMGLILECSAWSKEQVSEFREILIKNNLGQDIILVHKEEGFRLKEILIENQTVFEKIDRKLEGIEHELPRF
jgi:superfamily II RNA helicase